MNSVDGINTGGDFGSRDSAGKTRRRVLTAVTLYLLYFAGCLLFEGFSRRQFQVLPGCEISQSKDRVIRLKAEVRNAEHRSAMKDGSWYQSYEIVTATIGCLAGLAAALATAWLMWPKRVPGKTGVVSQIASLHTIPVIAFGIFGVTAMLFFLPVLFVSFLFDSCYITA